MLAVGGMLIINNMTLNKGNCYILTKYVEYDKKKIIVLTLVELNSNVENLDLVLRTLGMLTIWMPKLFH